MWDHNLRELFDKGGVVMWPLLFCSVLGLALILDRTFTLCWRSVAFRPLAERLRGLIQQGKRSEAVRWLEKSRSPVAQVAAAYLRQAGSPAALRADVTAREASVHLAALERRMSLLAMVTQVAPLLGLLGTVTGLVDAFHQIELKAGHVQPADLAAGIWEALLTTVFGLVIAVPCQMTYTLLDQRVIAIALEMEWITNYLDEWLHLRTVADDADRPETPADAIPARS